MKRNHFYSYLLAASLLAGPFLMQGHAQNNSQEVSEGVTTTEVTTPDGTREITIHIASASLQQPHKPHGFWDDYKPGHNNFVAPAVTLSVGQKMDLKIDIEKDQTDYSQCFFLNKANNDLSLFTIKYGRDNMYPDSMHPDSTHLSARAELFTDDVRSRWFSNWSSYYQSWTAKTEGNTVLLLNGIMGEPGVTGGETDDEYPCVVFCWTGTLVVPVTVIGAENKSENAVE